MAAVLIVSAVKPNPTLIVREVESSGHLRSLVGAVCFVCLFVCLLDSTHTVTPDHECEALQNPGKSFANGKYNLLRLLFLF